MQFLKKTTAVLLAAITLFSVSSILPQDFLTLSASAAQQDEESVSSGGDGLPDESIPYAPEGDDGITSSQSPKHEDNTFLFGDYTCVYINGGTQVKLVAYSAANPIVTIPDAINGKPVTVVGNNAFSETAVTDVTIGNFVQTIENSAFSNCTSLKTLRLSDSVTVLEAWAFAGCSDLSQIIWGKNVQTISDAAFAFCQALQTLKLPAGMQTIGSWAFYGCFSLTSAELGSVQTIGASAFRDCRALASVHIPKTVKSIGNAAFYYCSSLAFLTIDEGVERIGTSAFRYCRSLNTVVLPNSLKHLGGYAFCEAGLNQSVSLGSALESLGPCVFAYSDIQSIHIPDSITSIGSFCFYACYNLQEITLPKNLKAIEQNTFTSCQSLKSLTIPDSVTSLGDNAFQYCAGLANLKLPANLQTVGAFAFESCTSLESIVLPDSTISVGNNAFQYCESLASLHIGRGLTTLGDQALDGCATLTNLSVDKDNGAFVLEEDVLYDRAKTNIILVLRTKAGAYKMPDTITEITPYTFADCTALTQVTVGNSVQSIGSYAFYNCPSLQKAVTGNSVESIGEHAFADCEALQDIKIGNNVKQIGWRAFSDCTSLTSITLPANAVAEKGAFSRCTSLTSAVLYNTENITGALFNNCPALTELSLLGENVQIAQNAFKSFSSLKTLTLGSGVKSIGTNAFSNCTNLSQVTVNGNTQIAPNAFASCKQLQQLTFTDGVTSISPSAFVGVSSLRTLNLGKNIEHIGDGAFQNCTALESLDLPDSVKTVGKSAFENCSSLTSLKIGSGLSSISEYAFSSTRLKNLHLPDNVKTIKANAFSYSSLQSADTGEGVESIGENAFYSCTALTDLVIGSRVTQIAAAAFAGAPAISTVVIGGNVVQIGSSALPVNSDCTVYCYENSYAHRYLADHTNAKFAFIAVDFGAVDLNASQVSSGSAVLTWKRAGAVKEFVLYRNGKELTRTSKNVYTDTALQNNTEYTYEVIAINAEGICSPGTSICVTTQGIPITAFTLPTNTGEVGGANTILLTAAADSRFAAAQKVEFFYSLGESSFISIGNATKQSVDNSYFLGWDLTGLSSGEYTLKVVFTDRYGVQTSKQTEVSVDRTAPQQLKEVVATGLEQYISLSWSMAKEANTKGYYVYRKAQGEQQYTQIAQLLGREAQTYNDRSVTKGVVYSYYVVAYDIYEQVGTDYTAVSCQIIDDVISPRVTQITPSNSSYLSGKTTFCVTAQDNVCIKKIELYYKTEQTPWALFFTSDENNFSSYSGWGTLSCSIDTSIFPDGVIDIKALAYDAAGNISDGTPQYTYMVDNIGPAAVENVQYGNVTATGATLSWNDVPDDDRAYFWIEEKNGDSYSLVYKVTNTLGYNLKDLTPKTAYTYRVVAYDMQGNRGTPSSPVTFTTAADTTAPVITKISPGAGYYRESIALQITAKDDYYLQSLAIQISTDKKNWDTHTVLTPGLQTAAHTFRYTLMLDVYEEGSVYIRGIATDAAGNQTAESQAAYTEYIVDRTAPKTPEITAVSASENCVSLLWRQTDQADTAYFNLYRADREDGPYTLIAKNTNQLNYYDTGVTTGKTYYYTLTALDKAFNESAPAKAVCATVAADTQNPVIQSISPVDGAQISENYCKIGIIATDNTKLDAVAIEYKKDTFLSAYSLLTSRQNLESGSAYIYADLPMDEFNDGDRVSIKVYAVDASSNRSEEKVVTYTVDKTAPTLTGLSVLQNSNGTATVSWQSANEEDLNGYYIFRKSSTNTTFKPIGSVAAKQGTTAYTFTDYGLTEKDTYAVYRIEARDTVHNTAQAESEKILLQPAKTEPQSEIACPGTMQTGTEYSFNIEALMREKELVSYTIDFGDGTKTTKPSAVHAYEKAGTYTVSLTAKDKAGNTITDEKTVEILPSSLSGSLLVKATNENGSPINNLTMYMDTADAYTTDSSDKGSVFTAPIGTHTLYAYADGYLPVKQTVMVTAEDQSIGLVLVSSPVVTGTFEIKKMTVQEIQAAGIDITAAQNQSVSKVTVRLYYSNKPIDTSFYYNGKDIIGDPVVITDESGTQRRLTPTMIDTSDGPSLAYLDVPIQFSIVKEFFDVKLHIINNASSDFSLLDNTVTLHVPNGLSLVNSSSASSSPMVSIAEIKGQKQVTLNWTLRGDNPGTYPISADFAGTLSHLNTPVNVTFMANNPIMVKKDNQRVSMTLEVSETTYNDNALYNITVENTDSAQIYIPNFQTDYDPFYMELINAKGEKTKLDKEVRLLDPGCSLVYHYAAAVNSRYFNYYELLESCEKSGIFIKVVTKATSYFSEYYKTVDPLCIDNITIYVCDKKGFAVEDAVVTFGSETITTDQRGAAVFKKPEDTSPVRLLIKKEGYLSYEDTSYAWNGNHYQKITLYSESDKFILYSAYANDVNIQEKVLKIDTDSKNAVSFDFSMVTAGRIQSVNLYQLNSKLPCTETAQNGSYYQLKYMPCVFQKNIPVELWVEIKNPDGTTEIFTSALLLNVYSSSLFPHFGSNHSFFGISGEVVSFTIPKDIPFVGGCKFQVRASDFYVPYYYKVVDGELEVGINADVNQLIDQGDKNKIEDWINQKLEKSNVENTSGKFRPVFNLVGYMRFGFNDDGNCVLTTSSIRMTVGIKASAGFTVSFVVPVNIDVNVWGTGAFSSTLKYTDPSALSIQNMDLSLKASVTGKLGIGTDFASVGVYGIVNWINDFNLSDSFLWEKSYLTGEFGVYGKLAFWEHRLTLLNNYKDPLYFRNVEKKNTQLKTAFTRSAVNSALYNADGYTPITRENQPTQWLGTQPCENGLQTLIGDAYTDIKPQIVTCGEDTVMVFTNDNPAAGTVANAQALYYSVYNKAGKTWSAPVKIGGADHYTADFDLYTDGSKIYLAYTQSNRQFDSIPSMEEFCASCEVHTCTFDPSAKTFGSPITLTNNNTYDTNVKITAIDGVPTVVWVNNKSNSIFLTTQDNTVMYAACQNGSWSAPIPLADSLNAVTSLDIGTLAGNGCVSYVVDQDNDLATADDKTLYTVSLQNRTTVPTASGTYIGNVTFEKYGQADSLLWYQDNTVQYITDTACTPAAMFEQGACALSDNFIFLPGKDGANTILFDTAADGARNLQAMYKTTENAQWSAPVNLTQLTTYADRPAAAYAGDDLLLAFTSTTATFDNGQPSLQGDFCWSLIPSGGNAQILCVEHAYSQVVPGQQTVLTAKTQNNGNSPITNLTFDITGYDGTVLGTKTVQTLIKPGQSADLEIPYTAPDSISSRALTVTVQDENGNKSSKDFDLAYCDLEVTASQIVQNAENYALVTVTNNSYYPASGQLQIVNGEAIPYTVDFAPLEHGEQRTCLLRIEDQYLNQDGLLTCRAVTNSAEHYIMNNTDTIAVYNFSKALPDSLKGILLDGVSLDGFQPEQTEYTVCLTNTAVLPAVTPLLADGSLSCSVTKKGNTAILTVTDNTGKTLKTYTVTFIKQGGQEDVDKTALLNKIEQAQQLFEKPYTESTLKDLKTALDSARSVCNDPASNEQSVADALRTLQEAMQALILLGDVNLDTKLTINDVLIIQRHIGHIKPLAGDRLLEAADIDKDGHISVKDVLQLQKIIAKML